MTWPVRHPVAVRLVLAACAALVTVPTASAAPLPPAMFSPWYSHALRDILRLEDADVARLERSLAANPEDLATRLQLMAYHQRADRAGRPQDRAERARLALWLIAHHPDSELLHAPVSRFSQGELTPAAYSTAVALWHAAAQAKPGDAAVQWNAASFFEGLDAGLHMHYLETTAVADPNHAFALRPLAFLYALSMLERGPLAARAETGLNASRNVWVLGNAAYMFQSLYNRSVEQATPNPRAAELAERYFLRAKALDPSLDRRKILPAREPERAAPIASRLAQARGAIRRLPVAAFPELPLPIAKVLRARNCQVPQPPGDGKPRNVIRGEFFGKGQAGWAVLCSVNGTTALLAFRNDGDTHPATLAQSADRAFLQNDGGYLREIRPAGRDFIMRHYRAYGGPEPPPIDHHGIDDAFLEKASITWYWHHGKWLRLQGAD